MANKEYDVNVDYMAERNKAIAENRIVDAATYEALHNLKIDGEGLDYEKAYDAQKHLEKQLNKISVDDSVPGYDRYDAALRKALSMNYDDWRKGEGYQALVQQYGRASQRAMDDTLGRVAARTGGMASSYATSAAQQQYNEFMASLEDAAWARYNAERQGLLQGAALEKEREDALYQRYLNDQSQRRYENEWKYNVSRTAQQDARTQVDALLAAKQDVPDELLAQSGYSREYVNGMKAYYAQQGTGKGGGGGGTWFTDQDAAYQKMYDAGIANANDAYAWLRNNGAADKQAREYAEDYAVKYIGGDFDDWADDDKRVSVNADDEGYDDYDARYFADDTSPDDNLRNSTVISPLLMLTQDGTRNVELVNVPGFGWLTWEEVAAMVESGQIIGSKDRDGMISFRKK